MRKENDVLLSLPEVAAALGVSHVTAWRIVVQEHRLPAEKVGQNWAVWQSDVESFKPKLDERPKAGRPRRPRPPAAE